MPVIDSRRAGNIFQHFIFRVTLHYWIKMLVSVVFPPIIMCDVFLPFKRVVDDYWTVDGAVDEHIKLCRHTAVIWSGHESERFRSIIVTEDVACKAFFNQSLDVILFDLYLSSNAGIFWYTSNISDWSYATTVFNLLFMKIMQCKY